MNQIYAFPFERTKFRVRSNDILCGIIARDGILPPLPDGCALLESIVLLHQDFEALVFCSSDVQKKSRLIVGNHVFLLGVLKSGDITNFSPEECDGNYIFVRRTLEGVWEFGTDHYGLVPLYYSVRDNRVFWSNSLDCLLAMLPDAKPEWNPEGVLYYYWTSHPCYHNFLIKDISFLAPGSRVRIESGQLRQERYFDLYDCMRVNRQRTEQEWCDQIDAAMTANIKDLLEQNLTPAVALSGGVDSAYIIQKIFQLGGQPLAYTLVYGDYYNECDRVTFLEKHLGFQAERINLSAQKLVDSFIRHNESAGFPMRFDSSVLGVIADCAAADGVTGIFDGDGADREFLGSNRFLQIESMSRMFVLFQKLHIARMLPVFSPLVPSKEIRKALFHLRNFNQGRKLGLERHLSADLKFRESDEAHLYALLMKDLDFPEDDYSILNLLTFSTITMFASKYLIPGYEMQIRHGITACAGFWSDALMKCALAIPTELKLKGDTTKYILRKAVAKNLPAEYCAYPKLGLCNPYLFIKEDAKVYGQLSEYLQGLRESELKNGIAGIADSANYVRLLPLYLWGAKYHLC